MPRKRYLFTPGPTPVPPEVLAAMAEPMIHHRGADFRRAYGECLARLQQVFRTDSDVLLYTSSGTGAFEAAVVNLVSPGDRVVAVSAGSFGERWATMLERYGADVVRVAYEWGETPQPDDVRGALREAGGATLVTLVHSETSTGVVSDVRVLAAAAREGGALSVVDAVSSLGAVPLETDAWGLDVVVSGSQKALMTPPGLGLNAVSAAAYEAAARAVTPRFYFDWEKTRSAQQKVDAAFTPAVSLVLGVDVALGMILDDGLEAAFERHRRLGLACREGIKAMGLELFSPDEDRSAVVTAVSSPVDSKELVGLLRDSYGITIAGGQGKLTGKIFRIGHIGWFDVFDITTALAGVELALTELGADVERGVAVSRALEAFADGARV